MAAELLNKVGTNQSHWIGLSSDAKPIDGGYGSTFYEENTGVSYVYGQSGWIIDRRRGLSPAIATAVNDFLVASGPGAFVKKTLAETKTILELPASPYVIGDMFYASSTTAQAKLAAVAVNNALISGGIGAAPSWGKVALTTHVSGILPPVNGGDGGTTASASGPVTVTTALNRQTYVATGAVEYDLPTGDLSAFVAVGAVPLKYTFVKSAAEALTIDPGAGNFIANGIAAAKLYDDVSGETWATVVLQLVSSAGSVNRWVIVGAHGTWAT